MSELDHRTIKLLFERARAGDKEAFARVYEQCFAPIYRFVYFRVRSREEAEDLVQRIFLKVLERLSELRPDTEPLPLFYTSARNAVVDHWRKHKDVPVDNPEEAFSAVMREESGEERMIRQESEIMIQRALLRLPEAQREVITRRFLEGFSTKEIAAELEKSEAAVRQIQVRALRALKDILRNSGETL